MSLEPRLDWSPQTIYVVGHQHPDTDSIAASLGYGWLLAQTSTPNARAARAGHPGDQARYALARFEQDAPALLASAYPAFGHVAEPVAAVLPNAPLELALARLGEGAQLIAVVNERGRAQGVVTPLSLARAYAQGDKTTCGAILETVPTYRWRDRLSDHLKAMLRSEASQFVVTDDAGLYIGLVTQRYLLNPPRAQLILVDHNELSQAVTGADEADIIGVLDHHRLGNPPTAAPIPFFVDPVGSTSTLVAERCRLHRLTPPRGIAGMLLSGILSDTLVFRSPTCTKRDEEAADWLAGIVRVDPHLFGKELLLAAPGLSARTADDIVDSDRKTYVMAQQLVSIAQVEVSGMQELPDRREEVLDALAVRRVREGHSLVCLMVTDVVSGRSRLLVRGERPFVEALPFPRLADSEYDIGDMVSRKKQLAPAIQAAVESV